MILEYDFVGKIAEKGVPNVREFMIQSLKNKTARKTVGDGDRKV